MNINKKYIQDIIYNSGDVFLPENVKNILGTDLIGNSKKTFYVSGWSIVHFINGIIIGPNKIIRDSGKRLNFCKIILIDE